MFVLVLRVLGIFFFIHVIVKNEEWKIRATCNLSKIDVSGWETITHPMCMSDCAYMKYFVKYLCDRYYLILPYNI